MVVSTKKWKELLRNLGFTEQKNPNGNAYDVYDKDGIPRWQYEVCNRYETYLFFQGLAYGKMIYGSK